MQKNNLGSVRVSIELDFSLLDGRWMSLDLSYNGHNQKIKPIAPGKQCIDIDVHLPAKIAMVFSGKKQGTDTLLDENGNIIQDLHVKINRIWLDKILVKTHISKIITFLTESGESLQTDYIGFNGTLLLDLDKKDAFRQIMSWNRLTR